MLMYIYVHAVSSLDAMKDLVAESSIMKTFDHPNVLPLLGVCIDYDDEDVLKIVIPFMNNGDLKNFLKGSRISPNNTHEYPKVCYTQYLCTYCACVYIFILIICFTTNYSIKILTTQLLLISNIQIN